MWPWNAPAHVNIPKLMLEAKAANVAEHGMNPLRLGDVAHRSFCPAGEVLSHWLPIWPFRAGRFAGCWKKTVRTLAPTRLPGSAAHRLHAPSQAAWLDPAGRAPAGRGSPILVDVYAIITILSLPRPSVAVLHHNGIEVFCAARPAWLRNGAGWPYGDVETARETVARNVRVLAELAREGYPILCSEPTAAFMLRHDALNLLDDPGREAGRPNRPWSSRASSGRCTHRAA